MLIDEPVRGDGLRIPVPLLRENVQISQIYYYHLSGCKRYSSQEEPEGAEIIVNKSNVNCQNNLVRNVGQRSFLDKHPSPSQWSMLP